MRSLSPQPAWRRYLRFWRADVADDVDDELRFHLETRAEELAATGLAPEVAAAQARAELGDLARLRAGLTAIDRRVLSRHCTRERWRTLLTQCHQAVRRLRASPTFTIAAIFTLAVAIGGTASVFGVVDGVLLKPFPVRDADRVLSVWTANKQLGLPRFQATLSDYREWQAQNHSFTALAAWRVAEFTVTGTPEPERVAANVVTPNYFSVLGITPELGRGLSSDSAGPGEVVLGYGYWQTEFAGARSVLGRSLALDGRRSTIVGVMPSGWPGQAQVWTALDLRTKGQCVVFGRLKSGVTSRAAQRDMETIAARLALAFPATHKGWSVVTIPFSTLWVGDVRSALVLLLAAAACVLLIGAANLANLFLVRALGRRRELAVRTALGATRRELVGVLSLEAALLGLVASVLGVAGAAAGVRLLRHLAPAGLPRLNEVTFDYRVAAFGALASITAMLLFGLFPAWRAARGNLAEFLKDGARSTVSASQHRLQDALVVVQLAIALVLLTGAGLLVKGFVHFRLTDPGFRPQDVLTAEIGLGGNRYATTARRAEFFADVVHRLAAIPGVSSVGAASTVPGAGAPVIAFPIVGEPVTDMSHWPVAENVAVSPEYFRTIGISIRQGRGFLATDDSAAPQVVVVDALAARRFFAGHPIGRRIGLGPRDTAQIVGVVAHVKQDGLNAEDWPTMYSAIAQQHGAVDTQDPFTPHYIIVRAAESAGTLVRAIKQIVASLDPTVPMSDIETMDERLTWSLGTARFSSFLASLFAAIAMLLGVVGIYSVLAYVVSQRRRDIAVRIALGAGWSDVVGEVIRPALTLTALGIALGAGLAWVLTRVLASLFEGVSPHDGTIFAGAAVAFAVVALAAAAVPAIRTTRIDPVAALTST